MSPQSETAAPSPLETWPPQWSPSAVVLDCDGLLVDTSPVMAPGSTRSRAVP